MGNRIAVMKDGRIDQIGTPEAIVLRPETDYVARFVSSISTLKYLSASEIAVQGNAPASATAVGPTTPLPELISRFAEGAEAMIVRDGETVLGQIGRAEILAAVARDLERR